MKKIALFLIGLAGIGLLIGVMSKTVKTSEITPNPVDSSGIKVTDFRGKTVHLEKPAERIVCLIESALSGLYMLRAGDRVVGISTNVTQEPLNRYYAVLDDRIADGKLPSPGNWDFVSLESVLALKPDLVIIWSEQKESIESIESHTIPVYGVFLNSFDDLTKEITDLGKLTGTSSRADSLLTFSQNLTDSLFTLLATTESKPKIYFSWNQGLFETSGTNSTVNSLFALSGAQNAVPIPEEHAVISLENLLNWNPDLIVLWSDPARSPADILAKPELKTLTAVKSGKVFELPSAFYCDFWTLKYHLAVRQVAEWAHPELATLALSDSLKRTILVQFYGEKGYQLPLD